MLGGWFWKPLSLPGFIVKYIFINYRWQHNDYYFLLQFSIIRISQSECFQRENIH